MSRRILRGLVACSLGALALVACSSGAPPSSSRQLTLGTLLPKTGSSASLGGPESAGVAVALQEINDAGGVLDHPVDVVEGDSGDATSNVASQTVDRELAAGVDGIVGASSDAVTLEVIDKVAAAGVVMVSPANTSGVLSGYANAHGLFFRTSPPDSLQGRVLGKLIATDQHQRLAVLAVRDPYAAALSDQVVASFKAAGGADATRVDYDPAGTEISSAVAHAAASLPDAVLVIGFDEASKVVAELVARGIGPDRISLYLADGALSDKVADGLPPGTLAGTKGTRPGNALPADFRARLQAANPDLTEFGYAAQSYDAVILLALAAQAAGTSDGTALAATLPVVSRGGVKCTTFATCRDLLKAGQDIDYDGQSGPVDFGADGDPAKASIGVYRFGSDDRYNPVPIDVVALDVPPATR